MVRVKTDCDIDFCKSIMMSIFQRFKFGLKIVQILETCCCCVWMLFKKLPSFIYLELINIFFLHKFRDHFVNNLQHF